MGNLRAQQVDSAQAAHNRAESNKSAAASATSIPTLRVVVADNADVIQDLVAGQQRLEALLHKHLRANDGGP